MLKSDWKHRPHLASLVVAIFSGVSTPFALGVMLSRELGVPDCRGEFDEVEEAQDESDSDEDEDEDRSGVIGIICITDSLVLEQMDAEVVFGVSNGLG